MWFAFKLLVIMFIDLSFESCALLLRCNRTLVDRNCTYAMQDLTHLKFRCVLQYTEQQGQKHQSDNQAPSMHRQGTCEEILLNTYHTETTEKNNTTSVLKHLQRELKQHISLLFHTTKDVNILDFRPHSSLDLYFLNMTYQRVSFPRKSWGKISESV
jgi:hypothetical protein